MSASRIRLRRVGLFAALGSWLRIAVASPVAPPERALSYSSTSSRSFTKSAIDAYRARWSFAVARSISDASTAETSGLTLRTSGMPSWMCFIATLTWLSPENGTLPVSISYSTMPSE